MQYEAKKVLYNPAMSIEKIGNEENAELWEKLYSIKELSVDTGIAGAAGERSLYQSALKLLVKEIDKCVKNLNDFLSAKDMYQFRVEVHSIKSSLAHLGAAELSAKAYKLEKASEKEDIDFCILNLEPFILALSGLQIQIKNAFRSEQNKTGLEQIPADLAIILNRIINTMEEMNFEEVNKEAKKLELINPGADLKDQIEEILDAILMMDYESAKKAILSIVPDN